MEFYVYILKDQNTPFYVGYGTGDRAYAHEQYAKDGILGFGLKKDYNPFKTRTIRKILREGRTIGYEFLYFASKEEAIEKEIELISFYGRRNIDKDGILTNRAPGGHGGRTIDGMDPSRQRARSKLISSQVKQRYQEYGDDLNRRISETKWRRFKELPIEEQIRRGNPYAPPKESRRYGKANKCGRKPILQLDKDSLEIIREWDSAKDASLELPTSQGSISNAANGLSKTAAGFKWRWKII